MLIGNLVVLYSRLLFRQEIASPIESGFLSRNDDHMFIIERREGRHRLPSLLSVNIKNAPSLRATDVGESEAILCVSAIHLLVRAGR